MEKEPYLVVLSVEEVAEVQDVMELLGRPRRGRLAPFRPSRRTTL